MNVLGTSPTMTVSATTIWLVMVKELVSPSTSTAAPHKVRLRRYSRMPMQPSAVGMALYTVSSGRAK